MKKSGMYAYFHCKRARGCDKLLVVDVKEVTGLKKKLCMVCLLAAFLTAGCTQNGQEPAPEDEDVMTPVSYTHLDVYKRQASMYPQCS